MRPTRSRVAAILLIGGLCVSAPRSVAAGAPERSALLDVPYVSQTPELCGGAAVAMVLRYWGERDVFAQDFAPLVSAADGGIVTEALVSAVRDRGWEAHLVPGGDDPSRDSILAELDRGRPLIALIAVAPRTYHYVVVVGGTDQDVILHDPARAPYQLIEWSDFDRAWAATGRWALLVLPPVGFRAGKTTPVVGPSATAAGSEPARTPCTPLVEHAVQLARNGDAGGAEQGFTAAMGLCPTDPEAWRELAGLRFLASRWPEAQALAAVAVRLAPGDEYAWQLLGTSAYLMNEPMRALEAWNHTGAPRLSAIDIHGAVRTAQPVVVRAAGLQPRQLLTPEALERARRRLAELPVASSAQIRYQPGLTREEAGLATVDAVIDERPVVPSGSVPLAVMGARALLLDEVRVDVAGLLGAGEMTSARWRWAAGRPRVAVGLAMPAPQGLPGIVSLVGSWARQSYGPSVSSGQSMPVREEQRRVGLQVADWATSWFRWEAGAAFDRFSGVGEAGAEPLDIRRYLAIESLVEVRPDHDRVALSGSGGWWAPIAGGKRFTTGGLRAAWRSSDDRQGPVWSAVAGATVAARDAPLALWPGAGTGQARDGLLRAHPLLSGDGVVTGQVFGRTVALGSLEYQRPVGRVLGSVVSLAGFADTARAWRRLSEPGPSPLYLDVGAGVRLRTPGLAGSLRVDVAHGLRGGGAVLSAAWSTAWPD